jgi:hypothetical protein
MARYRVYSLNKYHRIGFADELSAADDQEAILLAQEVKSDAMQWEVWEGHRLVAEINGRSGQGSDAEYLIKREQQELEAALQSYDKRVRQVHLDLADAYTRRVNEAQGA